MSGETEKSVSGWTVDTLHQHLDGLLAERDKRYDERREQQQREVTTALTAINERLANLNELRAVVTERDKAFITRVEYDTAHDALVDRVNELSSRMDRSEGRGSGLNAGWLYLLGAIAAFGTVVSLMLLR